MLHQGQILSRICHRLQVRSGFGINRSSLRIKLHAIFAVMSLFCFEIVLPLFFLICLHLVARTEGKRENRTDILFSAVLPDLFWVIIRGVRGKQSNMFF